MHLLRSANPVEARAVETLRCRAGSSISLEAELHRPRFSQPSTPFADPPRSIAELDSHRAHRAFHHGRRQGDHGMGSSPMSDGNLPPPPPDPSSPWGDLPGGRVLASPWARIGARLLDGLILG